MGIFGWDLPPGCSQNEIDRHFEGTKTKRMKCSACGCFLKDTPNSHREMTREGTTEVIHTCNHCGKDNKFEY
ncbi:MAG: hypothetical protein AAGU75_13375 [Bacillota bacterium]